MSEAVAKTSTDVCPDLVPVHAYGHHKSTVKAGVRTWVFENEKLRDRFLKAVDGGGFRRKKTPKT